MMHACVRKHHELCYRRHLVEGQSYIIKNFNVTMNTRQFRPIQSDIKIIFMMTTTSNKKTITEIKSITWESNSEVIKFLSILVKKIEN